MEWGLEGLDHMTYVWQAEEHIATHGWLGRTIIIIFFFFEGEEVIDV